MDFKRVLLALAVASCAFLSACQQQTDTSAAARPLEIKPVPHVAWLSRQLPAATLAYARLPTLWNYTTEAKADALHPIQVSEAHQAQVEIIRQALREDVLPDIPESFRPLARLLLDQARSPIEMAALAAADGSAFPNILLATTLNLNSIDAFNGMVEALLAAQPQARLLKPVDEQGNGTVLAGPLPLYMHFAVDSGRLMLLSGMSASAEQLHHAAQVTEAERLSTLPEFESRIDATGRGLALWVDLAQLMPMLQPIMPAKEWSTLTALGLDQAQYLWFGNASKDGHGRWLVHLQMPQVGLRQLIPSSGESGKVATAGPPRSVLRLALPSAQQWEQAFDFVRAINPNAGDGGEIKQMIGRFEEVAGFELRDLAQAFGPELLAVQDEAGWWVAYQIRDRAALDRITSGFSQAIGSEIRRRQVGSLTLHQWNLDNLVSWFAQLDPDGDSPPPTVMKYINRYYQANVFWVDNGDYLISATVPHVLIDRHEHPEPSRVDSWLASQGLSMDAVAFGVVGRTEEVPRTSYHFYLQVLQVLANMTGANYDPLALPTASQAGLAKEGRYGLRLVSTTDALALSVDYQYSGFEFLFASSNAVVGIAAVGILAAIAIPAYQDYTLRTGINDALAVAGSLKLPVAEFYFQNGTFPDAAAAEQLVVETDAAYYWVEADTGTIVIEFWAGNLAGSTVYLVPMVEDSRFSWQCSSHDIDSKQLPASCR